MAKTFRWNITRVYQGGRLAEDGSRYVEVVIIPQARDILDAAEVADLTGLMNVPRDRLQWWNEDEAEQIEGRLTESQFIEVMSAKIPFAVGSTPEAVWEQRRLEEDMVFLQYVQDEIALEQTLADPLEPAVRPDVSGLLSIDDAQWLDFTQQARKMAATHYRRALGEQEEE
ncbi:MAG: hypothetical protein PVH57_02525 [Syntrophobacterales bacterium]|jgi:hypothetical protein